MPRNIRIELAYDGTDFLGWQRQENGPAVQEAVEVALSKAVGCDRIVVNGASRTDSGVHALHQVASATVETRLDDATLAKAINRWLPFTIAIQSVATVDDAFHARLSATGKRYIYRIEASPRRNPVGSAFAAWTHAPIDLLNLRIAARSLVGCHDFASFANSGSPRKTTIRTIRSIHISQRKAVTTFAFEGDGFLYNQVRTMVGTLLLAGHGKVKPAEIGAIRDAFDRRVAGPTAPAEGLILARVLYENGNSWQATLDDLKMPEE
ncbi:MAG: tRNA pseudouridine(38-40) synthase TruA [Planctomycetes bacterium]|nr:tRNA pseudouridine(38-40) synthase TruA [Planctomycetota bacterium]